MSNPITQTSLAVVLAFSLPLQAGASAMVDGYAKSSSGETWTSSSGDCVRTTFKDSDEMPEACGYAPKIAEAPAEPEVVTSAVEPAAAMATGAALAPVVAESFTENLEFGLNSAELSAADQGKLDTVISRLDAHRQMLDDKMETLNVVGYTDSTGAAAYNQQLSERRAQAVADYLAGNGNVSRDAMTVTGKGEADPVGNNATREGRQLNRRVVIEVVKH